MVAKKTPIDAAEHESGEALPAKSQFLLYSTEDGGHGSGLGDEKIKLYKSIKEIEKRLNDPNVVLNSFILSWTKYPQLKWDKAREELEKMHVLFMQDDRDGYIDKLFAKLKGMVK